MTPLPVAWPNEARAMRDRGMFPHEIGLVLGIPERTVNRYIERMVEEGRLKKAQWGRYALPLKN